jgi:hypothetical protein
MGCSLLRWDISVRRMVNQHPAEMLKQYKCKQLCADMHYHERALHWMLTFHAFVLNGQHSFFSVSRYISDVTVVPCSTNSKISTYFLSRKQMPRSVNVCLHFQLVWWMCVHSLLGLLLWFNTDKWNPCSLTCYSYDVLERFSTLFVEML